MMEPEPVPIAIAVVQHAGRVLLGLRPPGAALAGLWEFPGGKVQDDETPQEAAARECLEEAGLAVRVGALLQEVVYPYEHARVRLHFFAAEPLDPAQSPAWPFRWIWRSELSEYEFPAANADVIQRLVRTAT